MSDASIMKDGEESIPVGTAIARWADRAFKAEAEIDRLRAENANLHEQIDTVSEAHNVMAKEGDRLRAELAAVSQCYKSLVDTEILLRAKVTELRCGFEIEGHVNDRLRAENAELREALEYIEAALPEMADDGSWLFGQLKEIRTILAKTAKDGK